ncbi:putative efflux pump kojT [Teratosphaeria destructans]|uniref:Efflux pump kojT n=1 Tax=Teratosphaeria destructans TaxID=418781 RepID=A0A9W7SNM1_9PEZI|nr:putative efflux pump kojT [Teratosphaeria destructans]
MNSPPAVPVRRIIQGHVSTVMTSSRADFHPVRDRPNTLAISRQSPFNFLSRPRTLQSFRQYHHIRRAVDRTVRAGHVLNSPPHRPNVLEEDPDESASIDTKTLSSRDEERNAEAEGDERIILVGWEGPHDPLNPLNWSLRPSHRHLRRPVDQRLRRRLGQLGRRSGRRRDRPSLPRRRRGRGPVPGPVHRRASRRLPGRRADRRDRGPQSHLRRESPPARRRAIHAASIAHIFGPGPDHRVAARVTGHERRGSLMHQANAPGTDLPDPEYRLWSALLAAPAFPIALFRLGWTNDDSISPWSSLGACVLLGFSWAGIYVTVDQSLLDTYGIYAGSALALVTCWRHGVSGVINLVSRPMYRGLGVQWTMTLMGGLAVVQCPLPWIFYQYGPRVRAGSHFAGQYSRPQNQRDRTGRALNWR